MGSWMQPPSAPGSDDLPENMRSQTKNRSQQQTLQMLCTWLAWGANDDCRDKHWSDTWKKVEHATAAGTLPKLEDLEPVLAFSGLDNPEDAQGGQRLRRRRKVAAV